MATTPNFLWLEAILRHARAFLGARPDSPHTARYLDSVTEAQTVFDRTRLGTDGAYNVWRRAYHDVIAAHKQVRLVYDAARQECVEWGLDEFPDHFVSYMEEEPTQRAAEDMVAFLKRVEIETDWHEQAIVELERVVSEARAAILKQTEEFRAYTVRVRERKLGYDRAYQLSRELFAALKPEIEPFGDDYRKLSPYPLA